jgi:hypothetical protein
MFYNAKSVFLAVNASLRWLNNVSGVHPCLSVKFVYNYELWLVMMKLRSTLSGPRINSP